MDNIIIILIVVGVNTLKGAIESTSKELNGLLEVIDMNRIRLIKLLIALGIVFSVTVSWMILELIMYGHWEHRVVDDIVAAVLETSLYFNLMKIEVKKK
jgi:hypothetical protein